MKLLGNVLKGILGKRQKVAPRSVSEKTATCAAVCEPPAKKLKRVIIRQIPCGESDPCDDAQSATIDKDTPTVQIGRYHPNPDQLPSKTKRLIISDQYSSVSKNHVQIQLADDGKIEIRDYGSKNGTAILRKGAKSGEREQIDVKEKEGWKEIHPGDQILLGPKGKRKNGALFVIEGEYG